MENIFFNITYISLQQMLLNIIAFLLVSGLLVYILYLIFAKLLYRKTKQRREISLILSFLWALVFYFLLFNVYLFFLFYRNSIEVFNWINPKFYLGIAAQLTIYIVLLICFFGKRYALGKIVNAKFRN